MKNENKRYVLTLGKDRKQDYLGWSDVNVHILKELNTHYDNKRKESLRKAVTSIPSPFARMDLVKQAFKYYVDLYESNADKKEFNEKAKKECIWLQLLSAALDVGEIFFNYDSIKDKVGIISWGKKEYEELDDSEDEKKKMFADSISTFMSNELRPIIESDDKKLFILTFKGDCTWPEEFKLPIIGGTSPDTFFFAADEIKEGISKQITFPYNNDKPFDRAYRHLWDRDPNFIRYMYWLCKESCKNKKNQCDYDVLQYVTDVSTNMLKYAEPSLPTLQTELAQMDKLETPVQPIRINDETVKFISGLDLKQTVNPLEDKLFKCNSLFRAGTKEHPEYDYYTLADARVKDLNPDEEKKIKEKLADFLIPVKPSFFKEHKIEDIKEFMSVHAKNDSCNLVEVTLKVDKSEYKKSYNMPELDFNGEKCQIDLKSDFVNILPHMKFADEKNADYRVFLHSAKLKDTKLTFYKDGNEIELKSDDIIDSEADKMRVHSFKKNFDYIQITRNGASSIIYPKTEYMPEKAEQGKGFIFAVDLGTSNTHVAYADLDDGDVYNFDTTNNNEYFIRPTEGLWNEYKNSIRENILPIVFDGENKEIDSENTVSFPIHTAILQWRKDMAMSEYPAFNNANIPFFNGRLKISDNHKLFDNLKWDKGEESQKALKVFINNILWIIKNKVLQMGGSLPKTKILWFYPTSMGRLAKDNLSRNWQAEYKNVFGGDPQKNVKSYSESVAPVKAHPNTGDKTLSIDIGGGTSDFYYREGSYKFISSVRFASNNLFENVNAETKNGIIEEKIQQWKNVNNKTLKDMYSSICKAPEGRIEDKTSIKLANFFIDVANLPKSAGVSDNETINLSLRSERYREVSYLFFISLIYYAAQLIKKYNTEKKTNLFPSKVVFSGNGAKNFTCFENAETDCKEDIEKIAQDIFMKVIGSTQADTHIEIFLNVDHPKELTAKGGIEISKIKNPDDLKDYKIKESDQYNWFAISDVPDTDPKGNNSDMDKEPGKMDKELKYKDQIPLKDYNSPDNENQIIQNVVAFSNMLKQHLEKPKSELDNDLKKQEKYITNQNGWTESIRDAFRRYSNDNEDEISTSLFFEPIKIMLHRLSRTYIESDKK